ncbi:V3 protein [Soybean crinkle leaf virus]|uniref:V3 n=1 Tax=Ageratum yellow vein virus TaxID=44560 RepID=Q8V983_9GEMI|nr:V3 protein [Soybean crinkle leaf virus]BAB83040.1 V3 [Ageratum yellow vein virus]
MSPKVVKARVRSNRMNRGTTYPMLVKYYVLVMLPVVMGLPIVWVRDSVLNLSTCWVKYGWMKISKPRTTPTLLCFILFVIGGPLGLLWILDRFLTCMTMSPALLLSRMIFEIVIKS